MKKQFSFLLFASAVLGAQAQIVIQSTDAIQVGMTINRVKDTLVNVSHLPDGANQTWTFSGVTPHQQINTSCVQPSSTPTTYYNSIANQAITNDNQTWAYMNHTTIDYIAKGIYGDLLSNGNNINVPLNPDMAVMFFPVNYGDNFTDTYKADVTLSGSQVGMPLVYQVRQKRQGVIHDSIKGWGQLTTPIGQYNSLKGKRVDIFTDTLWIKYTSFTAWELESTDSGQTTTYYWLANEGKLPVAEISNSGKLTWTLVPAIPIADFSHNHIGGGDVEFTNLSINSPLSYTWDFGDSSPQSSDIHPIHTYLTNGTFNVCLTATNVSGADVICHDVTISTVTSLVENNQAGRLMVYPNPSEGCFVFESEAKMKSISISSVIGEKVWYEELNSFYYQSDLTHLPGGVYFYCIVDETDSYLTGKLVIQ